MGLSQAGRRELRSAPARSGAEVSEPQVPQPRPSPPAAAQRHPPYRTSRELRPLSLVLFLKYQGCSCHGSPTGVPWQLLAIRLAG